MAVQVSAAARPMVVVAMGGHAFMLAGETGTYAETTKNARHICLELMTLVERGYDVVITHGNGPQVGMLLNQTELTRDQVPAMPLDVLVAQTEGSLGYFLQTALLNELRLRNVRRRVVTMVTQVLVDPADPAFKNPQKPVGPFLEQAVAEERRDRFGWVIGKQDKRGWRRLVPSPQPLKGIQRDIGLVTYAARQRPPVSVFHVRRVGHDQVKGPIDAVEI